jgi:hypothetical protein
MDLHDRLAQLAGPGAAPTSADADADLGRARVALRRRTLQKAAASAFAVVAVGAAVTYGVTAGHAPDSSVPAATGTTSTTATSRRPIATRLVAYQGEQPKGFTIDKVPDGWEIQGGNAGNLTIAPISLTDKDPSSFVGKIAIMLQSKDDHSVPAGTKVMVAGRPGVINKGDGTEHGQNLWVKQPDGVWMEVQIWDAQGWTPTTIVELGAGIHVLPGAVRGVG